MVCRVSDSAKVAGENLPAGQAGTGEDGEMMVAGENTGNGGTAIQTLPKLKQAIKK